MFNIASPSLTKTVISLLRHFGVCKIINIAFHKIIPQITQSLPEEKQAVTIKLIGAYLEPFTAKASVTASATKL